MNQKELPEWMLTDEEYVPGKDRDHYLKKSILHLMKILKKARLGDEIPAQNRCAALSLARTVYLILLMSLSKNMFFTYCILGGFLIRLCLLSEKKLGRVFWPACAAMLGSALIMLPAVFLSNPKAMLTIGIKVFLSVGLVNCLAVQIPWNQMTGGLRQFFVPDIFILTLDITLKYIVLLGTLAENLLVSLSMRCVGVNPKKQKAMGNVIGLTFVKAKELSQEMYLAMVARGFDGDYKRPGHIHWSLADTGQIALMLAAGLLFLKLEGVL